MSSDALRAREWEQALLQGTSELGIEIPPADLDAYRAHLQLLLSHNARAGLTAITDPAEIAIKHFLDSLSCLLLRDIAAGERVADVGSGAGFPGLVLAIARPGAYYTLVESTHKRAAFLERAVQELRLPNVQVQPLRAEEIGQHPDHRQDYHLAVSRATASLPVALEYCLPLARLGGHCLFQKGPDVDEELKQSDAALRILGGRIANIRRLALPRDMGRRTLILVEKTAPTPARYARRAGTPAKRPL